MNIKIKASMIFCFIIIAITSLVQAGEMRTWKSKSGDTIEAELIKKTKYYIMLQSTTGKQMKIRRTQLSQQDIRYLDKLDALTEFDAVLKENAFELRGGIQQIIGDNIILFNPKRVKISIIQDPNDKVKRMNPVMVKKEDLIPVTKEYSTIIVLNARRDIDFDGGEWAGKVYPCGVEKVKNRQRIYKCFTTSFYQARQRILSKLIEENNDQFAPETENSDPLATVEASAIRELTAPMKTIKKDPSIPKKIRMK